LGYKKRRSVGKVLYPWRSLTLQKVRNEDAGEVIVARGNDIKAASITDE
jgi:hypothetical protein